MAQAQTEQAPRTFVVSAGGGGWAKPVVTGVIVIGGLWYAKTKYDEYQHNKDQAAAEKEFDTPEGSLVLQLATVFEKSFPSAQKYKEIMSRVTPGMMDTVRDLYYKKTGRRLSDDEMKLGAGTAQVVAKQAIINNTPGTLVKIVDDQIKFQIGVGQYVMFPPGSKTPISLYSTEAAVAFQKPVTALQPNTLAYRVVAIKEVPYEGFKVNDEWTRFFQPYVKTRKVYAAIQIMRIDPKTGKQAKYWTDARDWRLVKGVGTPAVSGLGAISKLL